MDAEATRPPLEATRPPLEERLRRIDLLLAALADSLSLMQRLLSQVSNEIGVTLREEASSSRDDEIRALRREVTQLQEAMGARAVIERAKGILMQTHKLSEAESFTFLDKLSQRGHRKLREVAAEIANGAAVPRLATVNVQEPSPGRSPSDDGDGSAALPIQKSRRSEVTPTDGGEMAARHPAATPWAGTTPQLARRPSAR